MITREGYSKDSTIIPEGIAVTFGKEMIQEKGGLRKFLRWFEACVSDEDGLFMHKCKNKPKYDNILYVYVIVAGRVYYRLLYGGYEKGITTGHLYEGGPEVEISWPRIILAGPYQKAPFKMHRSGFRGFRYTTKLF